jgi:hypothetical protein
LVIPTTIPTGNTDRSLRKSVRLCKKNDVTLPKMIGRYPSLHAPIAILLGKNDGILDCRAHWEAMKIIRGISRELVSEGQSPPPRRQQNLSDEYAEVLDQISLRPSPKFYLEAHEYLHSWPRSILLQ